MSVLERRRIAFSLFLLFVNEKRFESGRGKMSGSAPGEMEETERRKGKRERKKQKRKNKKNTRK